MILALKRRIISRFLQYAQLKYPEKHNLVEIERCLDETTRFCRVRRNTKCEGKVLQLQTGFLKHTPLKDIDFLKAVTSNSEISKSSDVIFFHEAPSVLAEAVLSDIHGEAENYGIKHAREYNQHFNGRSLVNVRKNENIVIDYGSPTISKPLNEGHLRSAVIGNFIKNISKLFNKNVTSINYLRDWGTHMGFMVAGYEEYGSWYKLEEDGMDHLKDIQSKLLSSAWSKLPTYVKMKKELIDVFKKTIKHGDRAGLHKKAKAFMQSLEQGDPKALEIWQKCRDVCVDEYDEMYNRLGIDFDVTAAESQYVEHAKQVISILKENNLLEVDDIRELQYLDVTEDGEEEPIYANLLKSDGTTYGLTRDVASTLDRFNRYSADRYIYVMDVLQHRYFQKLQRVVKKLRSDQSGHMELVRFGRMGVPTYKLMALMYYAQKNMRRIMSNNYTRVEYSMRPDVSNHAAVCKFIEQTLMQRRIKPFDSNMYNQSNKFFDGSFGLSMQFSHARLCSLIKRFNTDYSFSSIDFSLLSEDVAIRLIQHLARYHEVLIQSYVELEACHLVHYLKDLVRLETLAYEELWVLNQSMEIGEARLALFKCIKQVLANGMKVLGMQPLEII